MLRSLIVVVSALAGAAVFIALYRMTPEIPVAAAATFGTTAPMLGIGLAFPLVYLLWEQSEL